MLIVRGVNVFPSQLEEILLGIPGLSPHYVLELRRGGRLDDLTVVSETRAGFLERQDERDRAVQTVVARIKDLVGVTVKLRPVEPGGVDRSAGKAKRVADLRH